MLTSEGAASFIFSRARKGYDRDEVEALRARIVVALTLTERGVTEGIPVGADDLVAAELGYGRGGYDHREVDRFIDEAAAVLRRRGAHRAESAAPELPIALDGLGKTFGGYDTDEVARFTEAVGGALASWESGVRPDLTADEVERWTFATARRGYDHEEVEHLVARATRALARFEAANPVVEDSEADEPEQ
ncbi:MAG: DivIVA domain-containing protein [Acidimicrobiia bacterium]